MENEKTPLEVNPVWESRAWLATEEDSDERRYIDDQPGMDPDWLNVNGYQVAMSYFPDTNEVLVWDDGDILNDYPSAIEGNIWLMVEQFYNDRTGWKSIDPSEVGNHKLVLKFRGGAGYYYSFWAREYPSW